MKVDIKNNKIEQRIGSENSGSSRKELAIKVLEEFRNDGLFMPNSSKKIKLTQEEYDVALKEINKKGNDGLDK